MKLALNYRELEGKSTGFWVLLGGLGLLIALALGATLHMEHSGHYVTGMSNQIVWGMPHVFAIFLIVAASGALNVASIGTVFGKPLYKPLGRLSGLLAIALLPALAQAAGLLAKRVRAWKVGIQCLDQNWSTFDTPAGRRILENALVKVVMRVDETAAPAIVENLGLTGHHAEVILSAGVGEGILVVESKPYHVFFQASRSEVELLTPYEAHPGPTTSDLLLRR